LPSAFEIYGSGLIVPRSGLRECGHAGTYILTEIRRRPQTTRVNAHNRIIILLCKNSDAAGVGLAVLLASDGSICRLALYPVPHL